MSVQSLILSQMTTQLVRTQNLRNKFARLSADR
jgi:hypothetical protein